jgi:FkbM family methyltransferase
MLNKQKTFLLDKLINLISLFIERKKKFSLSYFAQLNKESQFCQVNPIVIENILNGNKLNIVDVGARGGIEIEFIKYRHLINLFLCEADPQEAQALRTLDPKATVFDSIIGSEYSKLKKLNIGTRAGTSSNFDIDISYLDFYCSGNMDRFVSNHSVDRPTNTLENLLNGHLENIDYLKIDTQGSEFDILRGIGNFRPIIIKCEVSYIPLYQNSCLIWDIQKHLFEMGYIMFHQTIVMRNAPKRHNSKTPFSKSLIPMHGDAYFMPDWTKWETIVGDRLDKYKALMEMFCLEDVYEYSIINKKK